MVKYALCYIFCIGGEILSCRVSLNFVFTKVQLTFAEVLYKFFVMLALPYVI